MILTSMSGLVVGKIFSNKLRTKSPSSWTTKGHQAVEEPLREGMNSVNTL